MKAMNDPRPLKATAALFALGYCTILLQQNRQRHNKNLKEDSSLLSLNLYTDNETSTEDDLSFSNITLDDVLITVKTTDSHKNTRLPIILKTWFQLAKNQTWFFTDADNEHLNNFTNGHMINTHCPTGHDRVDLCCKTAAEFTFYYEKFKKWFCHFDDDNYVNVPRLVEVLRRRNHNNDWYLGRNSITVPKRAVMQMKKGHYVKRTFLFGTGGAGYCISRNLAVKLHRWVSGTNFVTQCNLVKSPDDITMGLLIEARLQTRLTILQEFHSHIEELSQLPVESLKNQVSLSYGPRVSDNKKRNILNITGFNTKYDPTRFLSLHCLLFPETDYCPKRFFSN